MRRCVSSGRLPATCIGNGLLGRFRPDDDSVASQVLQARQRRPAPGPPWPESSSAPAAGDSTSSTAASSSTAPSSRPIKRPTPSTSKAAAPSSPSTPPPGLSSSPSMPITPSPDRRPRHHRRRGRRRLQRWQLHTRPHRNLPTTTTRPSIRARPAMYGQSQLTYQGNGHTTPPPPTPTAPTSPAHPHPATPTSPTNAPPAPPQPLHQGRQRRHPDHADRSPQRHARRRQRSADASRHPDAWHLRGLHRLQRRVLSRVRHPRLRSRRCPRLSLHGRGGRSKAVVKIDAPDHPLTLAFNSDGSLDPGASGPYQVHGRVVTGQDDNDDFTFAPMEQTCNLAVLAPSKLSLQAGVRRRRWLPPSDSRSRKSCSDSAATPGTAAYNGGGTLRSRGLPSGTLRYPSSPDFPRNPGWRTR